jgi:hypothetical protein
MMGASCIWDERRCLHVGKTSCAAVEQIGGVVGNGKPQWCFEPVQLGIEQ